ncbi:hypothetical protein EON79_17760 [bacterium]|nr:MAG: hypothetical protein EON79_17760 [bacterium]
MRREAVLKGLAGDVPAVVRPIEYGECQRILEEWRGDPAESALKRHRLCLEWREWGDVFLQDSGEMFTLDVEERSVGLIEFHYDGELEDETPAVGLLRLARRPSTFLLPSVRGVARPLVREMVRVSLETGHFGQVMVKEALGPDAQDPTLDARALYEHLGFETLRKNPGENSYHMELKAPGAGVLVDDL